MDKRPRSYAAWQIIFAILFVLSLILLLATYAPPPGPEVPWPTVPEPEARITAIASLITAIVSLAGLVSSTVLNWREEKREAEKAERERQRHELEMEKMRRELETQEDVSEDG